MRRNQRILCGGVIMRIGLSKRLGWSGLVALLMTYAGVSIVQGSTRGQQHSGIETNEELRDLNNFLNDHPEVVPDLKRDPSLIVDPGYLAQHPQLQELLAAHPGFSETI